MVHQITEFGTNEEFISFLNCYRHRPLEAELICYGFHNLIF